MLFSIPEQISVGLHNAKINRLTRNYPVWTSTHNTPPPLIMWLLFKENLQHNIPLWFISCTDSTIVLCFHKQFHVVNNSIKDNPMNIIKIFNMVFLKTMYGVVPVAVGPKHTWLLIPFIKFLSYQPKRNSNYSNYSNLQEILSLWQELSSKGNMEFGFKGTGNVGKPQ